MKDVAAQTDDTITQNSSRERKSRHQQRKAFIARGKQDVLRYLLDQADAILEDREPTRTDPENTYPTVGRWSVAELEEEMIDKFHAFRIQKNIYADMVKEVAELKDWNSNYTALINLQQEEMAVAQRYIDELEKMVRELESGKEAAEEKTDKGKAKGKATVKEEAVVARGVHPVIPAGAEVMDLTED